MHMILAYRSFDQFYPLYLAQVLYYLHDIFPHLAVHNLSLILRYKYQMVFIIYFYTKRKENGEEREFAKGARCKE